MPDRAKSTPSTPPPQPPAPEVESERMIRHTWLAAFDEPVGLAQLEQVGAAIVHHAREAGLWGLDVPRSMAGIGADLDSLAACLEEVADTPAASTVTREDLAVCVAARSWAGELRAIVAGIRAGLGEGEGAVE